MGDQHVHLRKPSLYELVEAVALLLVESLHHLRQEEVPIQHYDSIDKGKALRVEDRTLRDVLEALELYQVATDNNAKVSDGLQYELHLGWLVSLRLPENDVRYLS